MPHRHHKSEHASGEWMLELEVRPPPADTTMAHRFQCPTGMALCSQQTFVVRVPVFMCCQSRPSLRPCGLPDCVQDTCGVDGRWFVARTDIDFTHPLRVKGIKRHGDKRFPSSGVLTARLTRAGQLVFEVEPGPFDIGMELAESGGRSALFHVDRRREGSSTDFLMLRIDHLALHGIRLFVPQSSMDRVDWALSWHAHVDPPSDEENASTSQLHPRRVRTASGTTMVRSVTEPNFVRSRHRSRSHNPHRSRHAMKRSNSDLALCRHVRFAPRRERCEKIYFDPRHPPSFHSPVNNRRMHRTHSDLARHTTVCKGILKQSSPPHEICEHDQNRPQAGVNDLRVALEKVRLDVMSDEPPDTIVNADSVPSAMSTDSHREMEMNGKTNVIPHIQSSPPVAADAA